MSNNKNVIVSSEKGTILNYFSVANTYNPFSNENSMQLIENLDFQIPEKTTIKDSEWVAVSTGLITTSISFLQNCIFQIVNKDSGHKITDLTNIIGEVGNEKFLPSTNQIFWFNIDGLRGTFYIHKNYCGQYLKVVSGVFVSTSITSGVLNEMFQRSIGVPQYITDINNFLLNQDNINTDLKNQISNLQNQIIYNKTKVKVYYSPTTQTELKKDFNEIDGWIMQYTTQRTENNFGGNSSSTSTRQNTIFRCGTGWNINIVHNGKIVSYNCMVIGR